jgi:hypothetical protein
MTTLPDSVEESEGLSPLVLVPGLLRVLAGSWWRVVGWTVTTSLDMTNQAVRAVASGRNPAVLLDESVTTLRSAARQLLGLPPLAGLPDTNGHTGLTSAQLRARGTSLLYESARVDRQDDIHPAYERILDDIAPDEARILRYLAVEGSQPAVDVRTGRPFGIGSELVASGMTMIGLQAGVKQMARTKAYLNNLYRLGLVWFSHEPLADPGCYQVLEVQPDVATALRKAGRAGRTVRRSIELTPFGEDFCQVCLPLDTNGAVSRLSDVPPVT